MENFVEKDYKAELAYKLLLQIRDTDSKLLWTRIHMILIIQSVLFSFLATSYSRLIEEKLYWVILLIAVTGFISSIVLFQTAQAGSFWVSYWGKKLSEIEPLVLGKFEIFRNHPTYSPETRNRLKQEGYNYISSRKAISWFPFVFIFVWGLISILILRKFFLEFSGIKF